MNKKQTSLIQALETLAFAIYSCAVVNDLIIRYRPVIKAGTKLPESLLVVVTVCLVVFAAVLIYIWHPAWFDPLNRLRSRIGWFRWAAAVAMGTAPSWLFLYSKWSEIFSGTYLRSLIYLATLAVIAWLSAADPKRSFTIESFYQAGVIFGTTFLFAKMLQDVVSYPLSLSWSEGNRIWDYSLMYGRRMYNISPDKPIPALIDAARQSLWGLPFLLPHPTLAGMRLWNAILFTIPYALLGWFIFPREKGHLVIWFLTGLWAMLYLNQGPIYTPLILAAILVAGTRRMPLWLAAPIVFLAGYYANLSRLTWIFAPAIWAGVVALVEQAPYGVRTEKQRWIRAVIFGISGITGGFLINQIFTIIGKFNQTIQPVGTKIDAAEVSNVVGRQPLIWDRLLPTVTSGYGIIMQLLMAAGPILLLIVFFVLSKHWKLNFWQAAALTGSLLAFLVVGIIVSVKIGGGNNLHNLDMFLIGLLFILGLAWEAGLQNWIFSPQQRTWWKFLLLAAAIFVPATQGMMEASPRNLPGPDKVNEALAAIRAQIDDRSGQGEILFMDQRQLLTFGTVQHVPLVPEYEKKAMMDEAMADDAAHFKPFIRDLIAHRFSIIISEPLWINYQGNTKTFNDENNAYVKWVSTPVLCNYEPVETFLDVGVQILVPREVPLNDPQVLCPVQ
jgi:hypothetical protein